ncbi:hypothetical protein ACFL1U_00555 [Patescibacteria group bacterium]
MSVISKKVLIIYAIAFVGIICFATISWALSTQDFITVSEKRIGESDRGVTWELTISNGKEKADDCTTPSNGLPPDLYKVVPISSGGSIQPPDKSGLIVIEGDDEIVSGWSLSRNAIQAHNDDTVKVLVLGESAKFYVQIYCWKEGMATVDEYFNVMNDAYFFDGNEEINDSVTDKNSMEIELLGVNINDQDGDQLRDEDEKSDRCPHILIPDSDGDGSKDGNDSSGPCINTNYTNSPNIIYGSKDECTTAIGDRANDDPPSVCYALSGIDGKTYYREGKPSGVNSSIDPESLDVSGWDPDLTPFRALIGTYYNIAISFGALAAIIMIIIGGYQYATAAGNQARISQAKTTINYALLGLAVVILAAVFLNLVNPAIIGG